MELDANVASFAIFLGFMCVALIQIPGFMFLLQMTNVVETCLSFMRSSFRMSKHKETSSTKRGQDDVNSRRSTRTLSVEYAAEKNMQKNTSISNNLLSTVLMHATSTTSPLKQVWIRWDVFESLRSSVDH